MKFIFSVRLFQILFSELIKMNSKVKKKQTYFDKTWLEHEDFQEYVAEVKNEPTKYRCKICHNTNGLWLSNMGIGALKIHLKGPAHEANTKKIKNFFRSSTWPTSTHILASHCHQSQHHGKNDCSRLFLSMFLGSNIAKKYHLGLDNLRYSINFGLGPYVKNTLMESIRKSAHFVISFDEPLNKATQSSEVEF